MRKIFALIDRLGLPPGVASLVNGSAAAVDTLLDHPSIRAVSFVGSSPVARYVYERCAKAGKRVQCQGGAKNPVVIMPDADMETSLRVILDSAFGCAGQRCLAASVALPVGEASTTFTPMLLDAARSRKIGFGLDPDVELGPVITSQSRDRIANLVGRGVLEGGTLLVDGYCAGRSLASARVLSCPRAGHRRSVRLARRRSPPRLPLGHFRNGTLQRARLAAEHRVGRGGW
jgi:malonate-semialdehyde dehydrogenase (acetylating)/methylmalonate-semialdehyde dehydrogenase